MHKLESLALSCGSKIDYPHIHKSYTPILEDRFICVSQDSVNESKKYDYFDDVIFHIKPYLDKENIHILEIGDVKNKNLFYSKNYKNRNINQNSYILNKSILYFGNYNIYSNISSHLKKKTVCVLNNEYLNTLSHYWGDSKDIYITPEDESMPSFQDSENPKTINKNYPEIVAKSILDSLGIKNDLDKIETLHIGNQYNQSVLDVFPSGSLTSKISHDGPINIRLDKSFDLNFLKYCLNIDKFNIVTSQVIPLEYINLLKNNLDKILFFVNDKTTQQDISLMLSSGKNVKLFCSDKKSISSIRLKFIDQSIYFFQNTTKKDFVPKFSKNLKFLSKKNILSKGQIYNSYKSLLDSNNSSLIKDDPSFWEDLEYFRIYKEKS